MDNKEFEKFVSVSRDIYLGVVNACTDKEVGEAMHAIAYALAEIVADNGIPKKEFLAEFVERFDRAHDFLIKNPPSKFGGPGNA